MNKEIHYGDQVYIEISNILPPPVTDTRLLCSAGFLQENVYAIKADNYSQSNFRSCVFTVIPSLIDSKEDVDLLHSLGIELSFLSQSKPDTLGELYLNEQLSYKESQLELSKDSIEDLNRKILSEMDNQVIKYSNVLLFQHLESGYFLCADASYHPKNQNLHGLRLQKERTSACYFKFVSYSSALERGTIDYESEMKLISVQFDTTVTMAEISNETQNAIFTREDDEKEDEDFPVFPVDLFRRENVIQSFQTQPLIVGTVLESTDCNRIKLVEYCSRDELEALLKRKIIKSGDYVRFQLDDFYLTAVKSIYRENFGLFHHKAEGYKYNLLNSVFQIIKKSPEDEYPRGYDIETNSLKEGRTDRIDEFYIKHLATGNYLAMPDNLWDYTAQVDSKKASIPSFHLINRYHKKQHFPLTRNSRVALKVFLGKRKQGLYYLETDFEKYQVSNPDVNSLYYMGFRHPEDKIKGKLKLVKKFVQNSESVGSFFKVSYVGDEEIRKILEFESYTNSLKRFMRVLQCVFAQKSKVTLIIFESELQRILDHTDKLLFLMPIHDAQAQILAREFRTLDIIARLMYCFLISTDIVLLLSQVEPKIDELVQLIKNLANIILNATEDNELTHVYVSQYINVFIHCLLSPSPFFASCSEAQRDDLKRLVVQLLHRFLWDKDIDALGQFNKFESSLFSQLDLQNDYSVEILQVMNHYFKCKSPNLKNTLLENFVSTYLADKERLNKIFPQIKYIPNSKDFEVKIIHANSPVIFRLSELPPKIQNFLTWTFKLVITIAETHSFKFWRMMKEYYEERLCENLVCSPKVPSTIRNEVLAMLSTIHTAYDRLLFYKIPLKIQILAGKKHLHKYTALFDKKVKEIEVSLMEDFERKCVNKEIVHRHNTLNKLSIQKLLLDILRDEYRNFNLGNLESLSFALQVMTNLLQNHNDIVCDALHTIYDFLGTVVEKTAEELEVKKGKYYSCFLENSDMIFKVFTQVDDYVEYLAFQESVNNIRDLMLEKGIMPDQPNDFQIIGSSKSNITLEKSIKDAILTTTSEEWKSKNKLYQDANRAKQNTFSESRLIKMFWKIVEKGDMTLSNNIVRLIKRKACYEYRIIKDIAECSFLFEQLEVFNLIKLATSLLNLNRLDMRIQVCMEFPSHEKEDQRILDEIIENLQVVLLTLYDYQGHLHDESPTLTQEEAQEAFMNRFLHSKLREQQEIPIRCKGHHIKLFYQKVLKTLHAEKILVPFIKHLVYAEAFSDVDQEKLREGYCLAIVILTLFMYQNPDNQDVMANHLDFIAIFYDEKILNCSVDTIGMFVEMCKDNRKLLKTTNEHIFNIFTSVLVRFINTFRIEKDVRTNYNSRAINYLRSLPVMFMADIPKDMFDPAELMTEKFFNFYKFIRSTNEMSLLKLFEQSPNLDSARNLVSYTLCIPEKDSILIEMPTLYFMAKELLSAQVEFSLSQLKERVLVLQSSFTIQKMVPFLMNENIEFNFELKQMTLKMIENLYLKNHLKNSNIFYNYRYFLSFVSILLIDVYGYFHVYISEIDPIFSAFDTSYFKSEDNIQLMKRYALLIKTDIKRVVFFEYQSLRTLSKVWKDYVYYLLCDFFGKLMPLFREFMLLDKDKDCPYRSLYDIWFSLMVRLRHRDPIHEYCIRVDNALKASVVHSAYTDFRERVYQVLEARVLELRTVVIADEDNSPSRQFIIDLDKILEKHIGPKATYKSNYFEINLVKMAQTLGLNKIVLKRLCELLHISETPVKDIIFILRLFRKFIEMGNQTESNKSRPIYLWVDVSQEEFREIHKFQNLLAEIDVVKAIFYLLSQHEENKIILTETLLLSIALLFGGNRVVQNAFYEQFRLDYDNQIIDHLARVLENTLESFAVKEKERTKTLYFNGLEHIFYYLRNTPMFANTHKNGYTKTARDYKAELAKTFKRAKTAQVRLSLKSKVDEHTFLLIILEYLQNLCEGHYSQFQEFLRDQTLADHLTSTNIPEFLLQAYHSYYKHINAENVEIGIKILDVLIEMEQGESSSNVGLLLTKTFLNDICETLILCSTDLDLLARGFELNSNHSGLMRIKSRILVILKDLVERSEPVDLKEISQHINFRALVTTLNDNIFAFHNKKHGYPSVKMLEIKDLWDPNLSSAFMIYAILRHLSFEEVYNDFTPEIQQAIKDIMENDRLMEKSLAQRYMNEFFKSNTGSLEIFQKKTNQLIRIYFLIPVPYFYLKPETKEEFAEKVNRSNTQTKIADLMDSSVEIIGQMISEYKSRNWFLGLNIYTVFNWVSYFTNILALTVNLLNLFQIGYSSVSEHTFYKNPASQDTQRSLNGIQSFLSPLLIFLWTQTRLSRYLAFKWDSYVKENEKKEGELSDDFIKKLEDKTFRSFNTGKTVLRLKGPYSPEYDLVRPYMRETLIFYNIIFVFQSLTFIWRLLYFGICVMSFFHPLIAAFQLFDFVVKSDTVHRIVRAALRNWSQFLWTIILLLVTVYIYSLIGLDFMHDRFADMCTDAYSCFLSSLNQGLRNGGGIADVLNKVVYDPDQKGIFFANAIFDLTFFFLMITLLLNLIFGMIIDAFGQLRDEKTYNTDDKLNVCFICGIPRSEYERTGSFDRHISEEHNMWIYVSYVNYLQEKNKAFPTDLTDIENYVLDRYSKKDNDWLPVGRSLTLERNLAREDKEKKSETDKMRDDILAAIDKVTDQNKGLLTRLEELNKSDIYSSHSNEFKAARSSSKSIVAGGGGGTPKSYGASHLH